MVLLAEKERVKTNVNAYFKEAGLETTLKAWEDEWVSPPGRDEESVETAKIFEDWESTATTLSLDRKPQIILPIKTERVPEVHDGPVKLGLDATVELLTKVLGASDQDPYLSAVSTTQPKSIGLPVHYGPYTHEKRKKVNADLLQTDDSLISWLLCP